MVRIDWEPLSFISRTASTASRATSWVFAQARGSVNVVEKTTFDIAARASVPGSPTAANPDITRYVVAPIKTVYSPSGCSPNHARYSGPSSPHQPGQPSAAA